MLSISTLDEAVGYLSKQTMREWTLSEFFDICTRLNLSLRATVPLDALSCRWDFSDGIFARKFAWSPSHPLLAMLYPHDVASIWQLGEALAHHAEDRSLPENELNLMELPLRATTKDVRVRSETLSKILSAWTDAQAGKNWWRVPEWARAPKGCLDANVNASEPLSAADEDKHRVLDARDTNLDPLEPWGVSARYFARKLVEAEPTLRKKRDRLAMRVSEAMFAVGVKSRGGVCKLEPGTVKKAFVKLDF